jgi:hypothetical protein
MVVLLVTTLLIHQTCQNHASKIPERTIGIPWDSCEYFAKQGKGGLGRAGLGRGYLYMIMVLIKEHLHVQTPSESLASLFA